MLTDYFINNGLMFFASGWTQFAGGFFSAYGKSIFINKTHSF